VTEKPGRNVENIVHATFVIKDGKIVGHTDVEMLREGTKHP
jgi:hypothetical protein